MNAVVLTVKYSYVASTKYTRQGVVAVSQLFDVCLRFTKILKNETLLHSNIARKCFYKKLHLNIFEKKIADCCLELRKYRDISMLL